MLSVFRALVELIESYPIENKEKKSTYILSSCFIADNRSPNEILLRPRQLELMENVT